MSGLSRGFDVGDSLLNMTLFPVTSEDDILQSDGKLASLLEEAEVRDRESDAHRRKLIDHLMLKVGTLTAELRALRVEQKTIICDTLSINTIPEEGADG